LAPLARLTDLELCCNRSDEDARRYVREQHPSVGICDDVDELLTSAELDAVVVATPIKSHAELVRRALTARKHVFVEKPLCTDSREAAELRDLAIANDRLLFVGHLSLYDAGIAALARIVRDDPIRSGVFTWTKFGSFTESIVWNLLSHVVATTMALSHSTDVLVTDVEAFPAPSPDLLTCRLRTGDDSAISVVVNRRARAPSMWGTFVTESGRTYWWEPDELHVMGEGGYDWS
jgi:predicted dehydrogenase